jgi:hypothetical protein
MAAQEMQMEKNRKKLRQTEVSAMLLQRRPSLWRRGSMYLTLSWERKKKENRRKKIREIGKSFYRC